eukprot:TRINITY_DN72977_c0_g1_i1.p1 TRINITY_DN72977_c0_g1~~TRINITY_DN72977_c0_g1_i1.p1  ORF type:complete len:337 (+),score=80.02 TRINITY_DN72977_c0_g1_i1:66-1076(+)
MAARSSRSPKRRRVDEPAGPAAGERCTPVSTPLLHSVPLSASCGRDVWLKLEALQATGSFKDRGMLRLLGHLKATGTTKVICSSGGNAGLAAAHSGRVLGLAVKVIVPRTTKAIMLDKIRSQGAELQVVGQNWNEADAEANKQVAAASGVSYVHPFKDPLLWDGHASMIDEVAAAGVKPDALVVSVGGGGLLCGIYEGLARNGLKGCAVITAETHGADCFARGLKEGKVVSIPAIATVATSLGALEVTPECIARAKQHPTTPVVVSDAEAVAACSHFAADHRLLVEPACGAALAVCYSEKHRKVLEPYKCVVVIVCGGSGINLEILADLKKQVGPP